MLSALIRGTAVALVATSLAVQERTEAPSQVSSDSTFRVAVLVSTAHEPAAADLTRVLARAHEILANKTGARMVETEIVNIGRGNAETLAKAYLRGPAKVVPDAVIILSDDAESTEWGGYSLLFVRPGDTLNRFSSPVVGNTMVYGAVIDFQHLYARCGYNARLEHVRPTSRAGECRGQSGMACVDNGRYWMCDDSTKDPNADPDFFIAAAIIHEFMHPFGSDGDGDHYGTAQCTARTGMSPENVADRRKAQESLGMCPDLFARFPHK